MIFVVIHPSRNFTGYFAGVDFSNGLGSTGSAADAALFRKRSGFRVITLEEYQAEISRPAAAASPEKAIEAPARRPARKTRARK